MSASGSLPIQREFFRHPTAGCPLEFDLGDVQPAAAHRADGTPQLSRDRLVASGAEQGVFLVGTQTSVRRVRPGLPAFTSVTQVGVSFGVS
jgi:hypothetical protein